MAKVIQRLELCRRALFTLFQCSDTNKQDVLQKLVDKGNTVIIIEHNLDIIKVADYVIDMGLEGGNRGGEVVVAGTPEKVAKSKTSHTARFLREEL